MLPGQTNTTPVEIACYLTSTARETHNPTGLLPLPTGSSRLENLNAYRLQQNRTGTILAEGPGLVIFDSFYNPDATMDSPPDAHWDYKVPINEMPALKQVIAEMKLTGTNTLRIRQAVQGFFQDKFTYSTWLGPDKRAGANATPLGRFLLKSRSGHCEYFATATVLLLRQLGIPARYAVGYVVHEQSGKGYVVRERDAHAWCLVWNPESGVWEDFDTTPASWIAVENRGATLAKWFSDAWSWTQFQIAKFRWGRTEWRRYILWALVPVLALLLFQILFRRGRRRHQRRQMAAAADPMHWPGLDSEFYQLEKQLAGRSVPRLASEPLSDWLARALTDPALNDLKVPLRALLQLHYRYRFDPQGLHGAERESLEHDAKACLHRLARMKAGGN